MNIWIITTGSSDVQLKNNNFDKLRAKVHNQLETHKQFSPAKSKDGKRFLFPARAMGKVYGSAIDQNYGDLVFPLLDNFWSLFTEKEITPQRIIVLVTDQSQFFKDKASEINQVFSPYWQDTCTLEPLLRHYFVGKSTVNPEFLTLEANKSGLDNWNEVLDLVQKKLADLKDIPQNATVYVSHQAGTPAISSAVQFASLAQFGDRVEFLVSSEQDRTLTDTVKSGSYLRGIKKEQAKILLKHHDYAGVRNLLSKYLDSEAELLLDAAIQWNFAEFGKCKNKLKEHPYFALAVEDRTREENWWWTAYEAAYLGIVRLEQGNTVEAFFHSFRSFEGIFASWGKHELRNRFGEYLKVRNNISYLDLAVLDVTEEEYFSGKKLKELKKELKTRQDELRNKKKEEILMLDMAMLCKFFKAYRYQDYKDNCKELKIFWDDDKQNNVSEKRNLIVHQIQGMSKEDLMSFWGISLSEEWEARLLKFLNFIVKDDFTNGFEFLKEASLMSQVHTELEKSIENL